MIMNIKQRKIQIAPKTKLNYNIDKGQSCFKIGGIGIHGIAVLGIFFRRYFSNFHLEVWYCSFIQPFSTWVLVFWSMVWAGKIFFMVFWFQVSKTASERCQS